MGSSRPRHVARIEGPALRLPVLGLLAVVVALAAIVAGAPLGIARAADPGAPAPHLFVDDGPFTRNPDVKLGFVTYVDGQPNGGPVARYVAANDPATSSGRLVNGVEVPEYAWWALAQGPDGPRTIYGQVQYTSGLWSPVGSVDLVVGTEPASSLALDVDYRTIYWANDWTDWHARSVTPATRLFAGGSNASDPGPDMVSVGDGTWRVLFRTPGVPITAGTFDVTPPADDACGSTCAVVGVGQNGLASCTATGGSFTIHDLVVTLDGDVDVLDADFSLQCGSATARMSGSIRYGSARATTALDQDVDVLWYPTTLLHTPAAAHAVTFTNFGTAPVTLGTAGLMGGDASDFDISGDTCSGTTLAVSATCAVEVTFTPSAIAQRRAYLEIPDNTPGGRRRVMVQGYGEVQTTVGVDVTAPEFGPAPATVRLTVTPPDAPAPDHAIDGSSQFLGPCTTSDPDPGHRVYTCQPQLGPGTHTITASVRADGWYRASIADPVEVEVGTATSLSLATTTDDGIANGESATLRAALTTGGPIPDGTLRIRDGLSDEILAAADVSGASPHLDLGVTRATGTHPFTAEFIPADPKVEPADDAYDMVVVDGMRPETVMDDATLRTSGFWVTVSFSSPDPGASFECRVAASNVWFACASPQAFQTNHPGTETIVVRAVASNGLADRSPATRDWIMDLDPPGEIAIAGNAAYSRSRSVVVAIKGGAELPGVAGVGLANSKAADIPWAAQTATRNWTLSAGDGTKHVYARWFDVAGNPSAPAIDTIVLDTTAPRTTGPKPALLAGTAVSGTGLKVRLSWTGSDATSGIARYQLAQSRDGGAWATVATALGAAQADRRLKPGHTYRFRVRAVDRAGNTGAWVAGPSFRLSSLQEGASGIRYAGTWRTGRSAASWGGRSLYATAAGATARITVTGRSFAWVAATGPNRGLARVSINGTPVATVNLNASTLHAGRVVFTRTWPTAASRRVVIRVIGTAGHPRVDVDGFAWAS